MALPKSTQTRFVGIIDLICMLSSNEFLLSSLVLIMCSWIHLLGGCELHVSGQVDLAETDENGNENKRENENEKGNGRQEGYKFGIGRRPYKPTYHAR